MGRRHVRIAIRRVESPAQSAPPSPQPKPDNESYYRQCLTNLWINRRGRNLSRNFAGQYGGAPPPRGFPLRQVLEEPSSHKDRNRTPPHAAKITNDGRTRGRRVCDSANALNLWVRIAEAALSWPMGPEVGFGDDAIALAKRGRGLFQRPDDIIPASGYIRWR